MTRTNKLFILLALILSGCGGGGDDSGPDIQNDFLQTHDISQSINFSRGIFQVDFYKLNEQASAYSTTPKNMVLIIDSSYVTGIDSDIWLLDTESRVVYLGALQTGISTGSLSHLYSFGSYDISHGYLYPNKTGYMGFIGAHELTTTTIVMSNITKGIFRITDTNLYDRTSSINKLIGTWQDSNNTEYGLSTWEFTDALDGTLDVTMSSINGCQGSGFVVPDSALKNSYSVYIAVDTCRPSTEYEGIIYLSDNNSIDDTINILLRGNVFIGSSAAPSSIARAYFSGNLQ